jgi:replicative DNA helicase
MGLNTKQIIQKRKDERVVRIKDALIEEDLSPSMTGILSLDWFTDGGFRKGDLIVLSGRSGNGKTTIGLNIMRNMIEQNPILFTYELMVNRIYEKLMKMGFDLDPNIYTPKKNVSGDVSWINDRINEAITNYQSSLIIIDHLDFLTSEHTNDDSRRNEINSIITRLKNLAVEKGLIIILQVHVRKGDSNSGALGNNDLADSRSIANLADYVMFVNREMNKENIAVGNSGKLILTKNRYNGRQGSINYEIDSRDILKENNNLAAII